MVGLVSGLLTPDTKGNLGVVFFVKGAHMTNNNTEHHLTEKEAGHLADNLWLYRLRYRITREAMAKGICAFADYRDYEYGTLVPPPERLAQFAERLHVSVAALTDPPDYARLLKNYRIRKVTELYCLLPKKRQRNAIINLLRDLVTP